jgi:membrane protein
MHHRSLLSTVATLAASFALVAAGMRAGREEDEEPSRTPATPARSWKDVLWCAYQRISADRVTSIAGGVTFFVLLAIFPAIGALVAIYGLFSDPAALGAQLDSLASVLPGSAIEIVGGELQRLVSQHNTTLGATFLFSLALSLWSANAGIKALMDALNIVYDVAEERGFFALNAQSLVFTLAGLVFAMLATAAVVVLPVALGYVGLAGETDMLIRLARWPALLVVIALALAVIYRFAPNRHGAPWRWITWGSATAALLWLAASMLFSWYAAHFGSYNKTYGTLGAAVGFMTWIWISTIIVLAGAELDAELECADPQARKRSGPGFGCKAPDPDKPPTT